MKIRNTLARLNQCWVVGLIDKLQVCYGLVLKTALEINYANPLIGYLRASACDDFQLFEKLGRKSTIGSMSMRIGPLE